MASLLIFDDIFNWEGWGGKLNLGSGRCRLRIYDLKKENIHALRYLRPFIVVVSDIPESKMSIRSCAGHIATTVSRKFNFDHHRMLYIEYYPASSYGSHDEHMIPERCDIVDFAWREENAIYPRWRTLKPPMKDSIMNLINDQAL
jgi:hypothetical protein